MGVVAVRGTFLLTKGGPLRPAKRQSPLVLADVYDGDDPYESQLVTQTDLVPFRRGTDITFNGAAYTDDGSKQKSWTCGLSVGPVSKTLRVHGPRDWIAKRRTRLIGRNSREWALGEASAVSSVDLHWSKAYGGAIPSADGAPPSVFEANPLGCGIVSDTLDADRVPAPQIESADDPISDWRKSYEPQNLGLIPPFWPQRLSYAGTYDDAWISDRHPLLPQDFDFRFWQCAHPDLITQRWLEGDEPFELRNLLRGHPWLGGQLPAIRMEMRLPMPDGTGVAPFLLDGVHFDMRPGVGFVFLTWRAGFPWPDGRGQPIISALDAIPEGV